MSEEKTWGQIVDEQRVAAEAEADELREDNAHLRAELDAAQRRAEAAVGWADHIVDVMTSNRRGIVEERLSALTGYRKWREADRRGASAPQEAGQSDKPDQGGEDGQ